MALLFLLSLLRGEREDPFLFTVVSLKDSHLSGRE